MRKNLATVPLYIPAGRVPADVADQAVAVGRAQSLRGKAVLILSRVALEDFLADSDMDPEVAADIVGRIMRAQATILARRQAARIDQAQSYESEAR